MASEISVNVASVDKFVVEFAGSDRLADVRIVAIDLPDGSSSLVAVAVINLPLAEEQLFLAAAKVALLAHQFQLTLPH